MKQTTRQWTYLLLLWYELVCERILLASPQRFSEEELRLQSLDFGPCEPEGDQYCLRRVMNSMCSKEKNECFCKPGYVSIQEDRGISCKTLLTNLKCQVDSDCVHVENSACHPGAGYCACPGGTALVLEQHACRKIAYDPFHPICQLCNRFNGICYIEPPSAEEDTETVAARISTRRNTSSPIRYSCSCPNRAAMVHSMLAYDGQTRSAHTQSNLIAIEHRTPYRKEYAPLEWRFCAAQLVDIGMYCNGFDVRCQAKNSICAPINRKSSSESSAICMCKDGYIPVYQKYLQYHECFPQIRSASSFCNECVEDGGTCYSMNPSKYDDAECLCSVQTAKQKSQLRRGGVVRLPPNPSRSTQMNSRCAEEVDVTCSPRILRICYLPHMSGMHLQITTALRTNQAVIFVSDQSVRSQVSIDCILEPQWPSSTSRQWGNSSHAQRWCKTIPVIDAQSASTCGLNITANSEFRTFSGFLTILLNPAFGRTIHPNRYEFQCAEDQLRRQTVQKSSIVRRSYTAIPEQILWNWPNPEITVLIKNANGRIVNTVPKGSLIQMSVKMHDSNGLYHFINVEECSTAEKLSDGTVHELRIIEKSCPVVSSAFPAKFIMDHINEYEDGDSVNTDFLGHSEKLVPQTHYLHSSLFPAFILTKPLKQPSANSTELRSEPSQFRKQQADKPILVDLQVGGDRAKANLPGKNLETLEHSVHFTCAFRICQSISWCSWPTPCDLLASSKVKYRTGAGGSKVQFVHKEIVLKVLEFVTATELPVDDLLKPANRCNYFYCSDNWNVVITVAVVVVVACLAALLGLLLVKCTHSECLTLSIQRRRSIQKARHILHHSNNAVVHNELVSEEAYSVSSRIAQSASNSVIDYAVYSQPDLEQTDPHRADLPNPHSNKLASPIFLTCAYLEPKLHTLPLSSATTFQPEGYRCLALATERCKAAKAEALSLKCINTPDFRHEIYPVKSFSPPNTKRSDEDFRRSVRYVRPHQREEEMKSRVEASLSFSSLYRPSRSVHIASDSVRHSTGSKLTHFKDDSNSPL